MSFLGFGFNTGFGTSPKDPIVEHGKSRLVHKITCADCEFVYVGQPKRGLKSRVAEHKRAVKNAEPEKSALCEHLMLFDHRFNWNDRRSRRVFLFLLGHFPTNECEISDFCL